MVTLRCFVLFPILKISSFQLVSHISSLIDLGLQNGSVRDRFSVSVAFSKRTSFDFIPRVTAVIYTR